METLIAFDFDGTLYPIAPNDSEQMLMMRATRGTEREKTVREIIDRDSRGLLSQEEFNAYYAEFTRGCSEEDVEKVAEALARKVDRKEYQKYLSLSEKADLVVISCGTIQICEKYLETLGIRKAFRVIHGKELLFQEGKAAGLDYHGIHSFPDKAKVLEGYRERYGTIWAVGDGPTDLPMLNASDRGFIIDLIDKNRSYPFPRYTSPTSLIKALEQNL